ncbi:MAG: tripartite ATP-independent transporter DctM subunit [Celeribacter sp.]|jgi:C4-dicarboxylate transporter DctM subunit
MIEALFGIGVLLVIASMGLPLGLSMLLVGYGGFALVHPAGFSAANVVVGQQVLDLAMNYQFAVLPLFVLMGVFVTKSGISDDMYETANKWFGHLKGGLAMSTVAACGGMAAVSGSSLATAATMTKVAIPAMRRYNYDDGFSAGTVAAGGTIGILIPPSMALIVYGLLAEQDVGKLFMAGLIPGIISIVLYMVAVRVVYQIKPQWAPAGERTSWGERFRTLYKIWSVVALFALIMGGIFFGVFTASEGGGIGSAGALIIAILRKKMSFTGFLDSLLEASSTTAKVFTVAFGALTLNQFINMSGAPQEILEFIHGLGAGPWGVMTIILISYLILGMVIDGPAMVFLTVPIFVPLVATLDLGIDPNLQLIWFGIIVVVAVEISLVTPPIGMNIFIIGSMVPELKISAIYRGILPFLIADFVRLGIFVFFPSTVLWLIGVMN